MNIHPPFSRGREGLEFAFFHTKTREDVANLLEIDLSLLNSLTNRRDPEQLYTTFHIPKRSGGFREISAPVLALKRAQSKLAHILQIVYQSKDVVHGFIEDRNIVSNARVHAGRRYVLNVDLKDFFPSIHFGRVQGLFEGWPYKRPPEVAFVIARLSCSPGTLPQGAPTSPIISNMICAEMDDDLRRLAGANHCSYTRYADDLTFSTDEKVFPRDLAFLPEKGSLSLGWVLVQTIADAGFIVNSSKVRLQTQGNRQEVTGLVANVRPNVKRELVRQVRAMLHAWQRYGLEAAQLEFEARYYEGHRLACKGVPDFRDVVWGRIEFVGMVRGKDDPLYLRLSEQLCQLDPRLRPKKRLPAPATRKQVKVWTEGKTDAKHLQAALRWWQPKGKFSELELCFESKERQGGDSYLLKVLEGLSAAGTTQSMPQVFMFDRDNRAMVDKVKGEDGPYKKWGPMLYSFVIPVPSHRADMPDISIEFYYSNGEIMTISENNRRLYLSSEFSPRTTRHGENRSLICTDPKIKNTRAVIIDGQVFDQNEVNVALTKDEFATLILEGRGEFGNFDFGEFGRIFQIFRDIVNESGESRTTN
jgi:RNA-directed DNA polymerase